jgi:hypothetical protein
VTEQARTQICIGIIVAFLFAMQYFINHRNPTR